jgi:hypothetical protein
MTPFTAFNQNEEFIGILAIEAASADGPLAGVDLGYVDARYHAQQVGDIKCSGSPYVFSGDDEDRRRSLRGPLLLFGYRSYLDVHQVFETFLCEIACVLGVSRKPGDDEYGDSGNYPGSPGESREGSDP